MSFFSANLAVLQRRFPSLYADLTALPPPSVAEPQLSPSRSVEPTLIYGDRLAYSAYQPRRDAERALPEIQPDWDAFVLVGWGLGYAAVSLVRKAPDLPLLIVEPDPRVFLLSLSASDVSEVFEHPHLLLSIGGEPCQHDLWVQFTFRKVGLHQLRCVGEVFPDWVAKWEDCRRTTQAQARVNEDTLTRFASLWLRNHARNRLTSGWNPLKVLKSQGKGRAIVIAAAGPSLTDSVPFLRQYRSRYLLIAVDTAYSVLLRHGLVADFVTVGDGQYWNSRHLDDGVASSTRIITDLSASPRVFRWPRQTYVAACQVPFLRGWEQKAGFVSDPLPSGGSVATMAWSLALYLEAAEVWFAGLDLGYSRGTHAQGSQFEEGFLRQAFRLKPAETLGFRMLNDTMLTWREGISGLVRSDIRMDLYRAWLENEVANHPEVPVWNLSTTGSLIKGLKRPVDETPREYDGATALTDTKLTRNFAPWQNDTWHQMSFFVPDVRSAITLLLERWPPKGTYAITHEFCQAWENAVAVLRKAWGDATWSFLTKAAVRTWETFPGPRSLARLNETIGILSSLVDVAQEIEKTIFLNKNEIF
ncbi:MAG: motility associated factor glycosyltransferase family protein [Spirochaetales bacterium]|nr:motility associated factor glycosyltransferase family protein [Spirochaetales bacterium]